MLFNKNLFSTKIIQQFSELLRKTDKLKYGFCSNSIQRLMIAIDRNIVKLVHIFTLYASLNILYASITGVNTKYIFLLFIMNEFDLFLFIFFSICKKLIQKKRIFSPEFRHEY
jgi:hypothetical protein